MGWALAMRCQPQCIDMYLYAIRRRPSASPVLPVDGIRPTNIPFLST
jgi:hypothetical protein